MHIIKIFKPFTLLQIPKIEKWLAEQSEKGLKLIDYRWWTFSFALSQPQRRQYFIHIFRYVNGKIGDFYDKYLTVKSIYGKKKTALNKVNDNRFLQIVHITEIDKQKVDDDYGTYLLARNSHYQRYELEFFATILLLWIMSFILSFFRPVGIVFSFLSLLPLIYSLISLFVLKRQKRQLVKETKEHKNL